MSATCGVGKTVSGLALSRGCQHLITSQCFCVQTKEGQKNLNTFKLRKWCYDENKTNSNNHSKPPMKLMDLQ